MNSRLNGMEKFASGNRRAHHFEREKISSAIHRNTAVKNQCAITAQPHRASLRQIRHLFPQNRAALKGFAELIETAFLRFRKTRRIIPIDRRKVSIAHRETLVVDLDSAVRGINSRQEIAPL